MNFMILDIDEDEEIPIILGQFFLNIRGSLIDVREGKLTWQLGDEEEVFKVFGTAKCSFSSPFYNFVQAINNMEFIMAKFHSSVEIYSFLEEVTSFLIMWSTSSISYGDIFLPQRSYLNLNFAKHQFNLMCRYTPSLKKLPQSLVIWGIRSISYGDILLPRRSYLNLL